MRRRIYHFSKRLLILLVGIPVVAVGIALIPLPGPGLLVVAAGLAILSLEFEWARRWLDHTKDRLEQVVNQARKGAQKKSDQGKKDED